jgi:hypothetical protein
MLVRTTARLQPMRVSWPHNRDADLLVSAQTHDAHSRSDSASDSELLLEEHRIRRIEDNRNVEFLLVMELLEVRPLDAREDVPVDEADVIARRIIAVIAKLRARAALGSEVLAACAIGKPPGRIQPQSRQPIQVAIAEAGT